MLIEKCTLSIANHDVYICIQIMQRTVRCIIKAFFFYGKRYQVYRIFAIDWLADMLAIKSWLCLWDLWVRGEHTHVHQRRVSLRGKVTALPAQCQEDSVALWQQEVTDSINWLIGNSWLNALSRQTVLGATVLRERERERDSGEYPFNWDLDCCKIDMLSCSLLNSSTIPSHCLLLYKAQPGTAELQRNWK